MVREEIRLGLNRIRKHYESSDPIHILVSKIHSIVINRYDFQRVNLDINLHSKSDYIEKTSDEILSASGTMVVSIIAAICTGLVGDRQYKFVISFIDDKQTGLFDRMEINYEKNNQRKIALEKIHYTKLDSFVRVDDDILLVMNAKLESNDGNCFHEVVCDASPGLKTEESMYTFAYEVMKQQPFSTKFRKWMTEECKEMISNLRYM